MRENTNMRTVIRGKLGDNWMFWQALEQLHRWERENLPVAATPVGNEVLVWLLKSRSNPKPLKDLYRSSRFSEPTIRSCLKQFSAFGFIVVENSGADMRTRFALTTRKLEGTILEYSKRFQEVAELARQESTMGENNRAKGHRRPRPQLSV